MMELRPYQLRDVERLGAAYTQGARAVLYCLPTGGGKTHVFTHAVDKAARRGYRVGVIEHRRELVLQAAGKLSQAGVAHGIIAAGLDRDHDAPVLVMSVQTAWRRLDQLPRLDFMVLDEVHHSVSDTWSGLIGYRPKAKILGVTATPARLDGKGLGVEAGGFFDALVMGATVTELQGLGFLAPSRVFVPGRTIDTSGVHKLGGDFQADELAVRANVVTGDAVREYRTRADHQPAIAYGCTVAHAQSIASAFRVAGYRSACVHCGLPMVERDRLIQGLATGEIEVLTSCDLISEGLDIPSVGAVILLRPTQSLALAMQQIGRGMRPAEGKDCLRVLDHAGNCLKHGLPETERAWTLNGAPKPNGGHTPGWRCEACGLLNSLGDELCAECGAHRRPAAATRRPPAEIAGVLRELTAEAFPHDDLNRIIRMPYARFMSEHRTERELRAYAEARGYKPGWVWHRLQEQQWQRSRGLRA